MTHEHVELANLIMGRTTTAAVEAVLAAGYSKRAEQVTEIFADSSKVFMVVCQDPEAHARSYNEGYEAAVIQGLADNPTLADDWFQAKLREARAQAVEAAVDDFSVNLTAMSGPRIREWLRARAAAERSGQ